jgi:hypothetical protein
VVSPEKNRLAGAAALDQQVEGFAGIGTSVDVVAKEHLDWVRRHAAGQVSVDHVEHFAQ